MWKVLLIVLVLAAGVTGWLLWTQNRAQPLVVSGFVEADQIRVGSRIGGRVAKVLVAEGQSVKTGDPLFELEPFDLRERLQSAKAQAAAAREDFNRLTQGYREEEKQQAVARRDRLKSIYEKSLAGARPQEIEIADQKVNVAQTNLDLATAEHKNVMASLSAASALERDRAINQLRKAEAELSAAKLDLALLKEGPRAEDKAEAKAALAEAQAALELVNRGYRLEDQQQAKARLDALEAEARAIETQLAELTIKSPADCTVEAIDLRPGDLVSPNAPAVSLLETGRLWVRSYVPEGQMGHTKLKQRVPVRFDSLPGKTFTGRITFIAAEGEFTPRNIQTPEERSKQVFRIKVTMEDGRSDLRVGMMGDVLLGEARDE